MTALQLSVDTPTEHFFSVSMSGLSPTETVGRLTLDLPGYSISFPGRVSEDGKMFEVRIPPLDRVLVDVPIQASAQLEIIGRGYHTVPWAGSVVIESRPKVSASAIGVVSVTAVSVPEPETSRRGVPESPCSSESRRGIPLTIEMSRELPYVKLSPRRSAGEDIRSLFSRLGHSCPDSGDCDGS